MPPPNRSKRPSRASTPTRSRPAQSKRFGSKPNRNPTWAERPIDPHRGPRKPKANRPPKPQPSQPNGGKGKPSGKGGSGGGATPSGIRLQRVMADAGVASRRECEEMITAGRVEVNGHAVTELPAFVHPSQDRITVDGRALARDERSHKRVYVMLNKPDNTLGTTRDQLEYAKGGRRTVNDLVQHASGARLFPVGRLDFHSTGLVLMTNDGELADRLTHARYGVTKTFRVWVNGFVRPDILDMLRRRIGKRDGVDGQGRVTGGVHIINDDEEQHGRRHRTERDSKTTIVEIQMRDGKTDPLDEMLVTAGCRVRRIARVAIGPLKLMGVRPGEWRDLTKDELRSLKDAAGLLDHRAPKPPRPKRANPTPEIPPRDTGASGSPSPAAAPDESPEDEP